MALLNGMYIFVESEDTGRAFDISQHPVDKGLPVTDCVNRKPATLDISGIIPNNPDDIYECENKRQKIVQLASSGSLVTYQNANYYIDCLISNFQTTHTAEIGGAMGFSMTIQEVLFAKSPYDESKKISAKQTIQEAPVTVETGETQYVIHIVEPGDTIWDLCIKDDAPYKQYGWSVEKVLQENPDCFSTPGDARTMQIGTELAVGYR